MSLPDYNGFLAVALASTLILSGAGAFGTVIGGHGSAGEQTGAVASQTTTQSTTTTTTTATTSTVAPSTTAAASKDVEVVIEHWDNKVGIAINGGDDANAVTDIRVEGANMTSKMDINSDYPKTVATINPPTTVRVIATFEDGTTQVVAERKIG